MFFIVSAFIEIHLIGEPSVICFEISESGAGTIKFPPHFRHYYTNNHAEETNKHHERYREFRHCYSFLFHFYAVQKYHKLPSQDNSSRLARVLIPKKRAAYVPQLSPGVNVTVMLCVPVSSADPAALELGHATQLPTEE
jgi:hypothetical protein